MAFTRTSFCKVNLLLNVLGRREDGFHDLETVLLPVPLHDSLEFERSDTAGVRLSCNLASLPVDDRNLVHRAATAFFKATDVTGGVSIHLEKRIPLESGLGGGSGNAAATLLAMNELCGQPLKVAQLVALAAQLGSDVPFFLEEGPALATGRGEKITRLNAFAGLRGAWIFLVHPGFGVPTPWAYKQLAGYPEALNGKPGRAQALIDALGSDDPAGAATHLFNSLEAPVLNKYPLLMMFQEHLKTLPEVVATLMSGSGSTTFALARSEGDAERIRASFLDHFGDANWSKVVALSPTTSPA